MQCCTVFSGEGRLETQILGQRIATRIPDADAGVNTGLTPVELLLAGLSACAAEDAIQWLQRRKISLDGFHLHLLTMSSATSRGLYPIRAIVETAATEADDRKDLLKTVQISLSSCLFASAIDVRVEAASACHSLELRGCHALAAIASKPG